MQSDSLRARVIKYIQERLCTEQGGFCFYRLEEPSGADTYYSIRTLHTLSHPFSDERTISYLENLQYVDGSYESIFSAFYSIKGLNFLKRKPLHDPANYILGKMSQYHIKAEDIPAEITSIFKQLLYLVEIYKCSGLSIAKIERNIRGLVLQFQNSDGGFGYNNSSLDETAKGLRILKLMDFKTDDSKIHEFIKKCEKPDYGFTDVPGSSLSYIENIHAGLKASHLTLYKPLYLNACDFVISGCQRRNGGFSRAISDGIATIENTYFAVHSLALISILRYTNSGINAPGA